MLRESSRIEKIEVDLTVVSEGQSTQAQMPAQRELLAFAEAAFEFDRREIESARVALIANLGEAAMVDAACVIANFQRMVRIADATGIPLDTPVSLVTADLRETLGINQYGSAENTEAVVGLKRILGRVLGKLLPYIFKLMQRSN